LAIVFAVGWMNMMQRYDNQHNNLLSQALSAPHVAMVLKGPAAQHGMSGEVIVPKSGNGGLLIISGLSTAPPANMHYMCWLQKGGRWTAWGPLKPDASGLAMFVMHDSTDPHNAKILAITLEHAGSPLTKPSAPMLLSTTL
jgi:Anti-sigma-K factor rskA, C-terminal